MRRAVLPRYLATFLMGVIALPAVAGAQSASGASESSVAEAAEGERLVHNMDCDVCHTPKVMTAAGPRPDTTRRLSGHPAGAEVPPLPAEVPGEGGWGGLFNHLLTAWAGPWGVSYGSNLTPDEDTGIGTWSEQTFVESMRSGIHVGELRPFLPPMPTYDRLTDAELHAIFIYLQSIEPVSNEVPTPRPPVAPPAGVSSDP